MTNYLKNLLYFVLLLLLSSSSLYAQEQYTLFGKISNENGEAVPYTAIYIESLQRSSMANEEGEF